MEEVIDKDMECRLFFVYNAAKYGKNKLYDLFMNLKKMSDSSVCKLVIRGYV